MSNVKNVMCYQSVLINLAHRLCTDIQYFLYLYNPDDADVVEPYSMNWLDCFASILSPNHQRRLDFDKQAMFRGNITIIAIIYNITNELVGYKGGGRHGSEWTPSIRTQFSYSLSCSH